MICSVTPRQGNRDAFSARLKQSGVLVQVARVAAGNWFQSCWTHQMLYSVSQKNPPPRNFLTFFPKRLGIFSSNFTCLLNVPIYAGLQIFIQLPATLTKLCHILSATTIMCSKCPPSTETHAGWSRVIWHNSVTVGDN